MGSIRTRTATTSDLDFVVATWLDSYRTAHAAGLIAMERWRDVMAVELRDVLARPDCGTWIAHAPSGSPDSDAYGWLCAETGYAAPLVHYCYVKAPYRRLGIARALLRAADIDPRSPLLYTCKTPVVRRLPLPLARWNPLIARFAKETK